MAWLPPMCFGLIGDVNLTVGVSVSTNYCLTVGPFTDWQPV